MKRLVLIASLLLFNFAQAYQHQISNTWLSNIKQDIQVKLIVSTSELKKVVKDLKQKDLDVTYVNNNSGEIHVLLNQEDFDSLKIAYPELSVKSSRYILKGPDAQYKTYDEIKEIIAKIQNEFPDLVHTQKIGKSLEGRDIIAVRISDDKEFNMDEPAVLFNALHHAREVMSVEIIQDILESLTQGYATNENVRAWVDKMQIWLIPMVNPDGSNKVWTSDAMWRKNTRNDKGVDINRNYPYKWGECNGSSTSPSAQDYRGPSAGSEPETQTMMAFIEKTKPLYNISYHSYGEMVIHPFGCKGFLPDPVDQVVETAKTLGAFVKHKVGASWQILYDVDGGDIDWMYGVHHVIPYVLEVSTNSDGFQPPYSRRNPVVSQNKVGWQYILAKVSGVGMPQVSTRTPTQHPTTIRWGGQWFTDARKNYSQKRRSIMVNNDYNLVKIRNVHGRTIIQHPLTPTKSTQHYMLTPGEYSIQVLSSRGSSLSQQSFSVIKDSENTVEMK